MIEGGCNLLLGSAVAMKMMMKYYNIPRMLLRVVYLQNNVRREKFLIEPNPLPYKIHKASSENLSNG